MSEDVQEEKNDSNPLDIELKGSATHPSVFISYAWGDDQHKKQVRLFADRLIAKGIKVMIDQYDVEPGQDLYAFMENCVTNKEINYVLVIADELYKDKADSRSGGVGSESQLISAEVYPKVDQTKYIPLIFQKDRNGKAFLPTFFKSRFSIDLSDKQTYDIEFSRLVRHLWGEPELVKPPLGRKPVFEITETDSNFAIEQEFAMANSSSYPSLEPYSTLREFERFRNLPKSPKPRDEKVVEVLQNAKPLEVRLLSGLEAMVINSKQKSALDKEVEEFITNTLSTLQEYTYPPAGIGQWGSYDYDHFGFIVNEMAIQVTALLIKHKKYQLIGRLMAKTYFYTTNTGVQKYGTFEEFRHYVPHLDENRNTRLKLNRVSVMADLLRERSDSFDINFKQLMCADLILYLISKIMRPKENGWWFPRLSVFYDRSTIQPLGEMVSKERAKDIVAMFGCNTIEDFKKKLETAQIAQNEMHRGGFSSFDYEIPQLRRSFPEQIASVP